MTADLVIRNALILDGSGGPGFPGDVEVTGGRIAAVGTAGTGRKEFDAGGRALSPGFVDTHSHDDGAFIRYPGMEFKLSQGVTSEVSGNCGSSGVPNAPGRQLMPGDLVGTKAATWTDLDSYFAACMERKPAINNMMLVGHNRVRALVVGRENRACTGAELADMRGHVRQAMEQGACGLSTRTHLRAGEIREHGRSRRPRGGVPSLRGLVRDAHAKRGRQAAGGS